MCYTSEVETSNIVTSDVPEHIAQSLLPWNRDDHKARYLSYRASGFTIRESLHMIGCAQSTLSLWRHDPQFVELENNIQQIAQKLRTEYTSLEFTRNFRLIMEKDYQVLKASLNGGDLTRDEQSYLLKMRGFYTPQQLQIIEALVQGELEGGSKFSWTEAVLTFRKIEERTIKLRQQTIIEQNKVEVDNSALPEMPQDNGQGQVNSSGG